MPSSWVEIIRAGLTATCLFLFAILSITLGVIAVYPYIAEEVGKWRKAKKTAKGVAIIALVAAVLYGGTKPVQNAGADDGYDLVSVAVEYDETNDVTLVEVSFTGENIGTTTPVSVRNSEYQSWTELAKINPTKTSDMATNVLTFTASGNVATNRYWWVGTETPAVIVETTGIEIVLFSASSESVQIAWTCDDPNATEFTIQRRHKGESEWETVGVTTSFAFVYVGFTVGETWEWRVVSSYTGGN